ncbi:molybdopterin converting factor subunit 1 [Anaeromyxobacter paludicola]|uniref:Molybdopterin synthase catalytic subunit n=1 Tax=Anaeromyxobacter paludicola TaxID=2918171 RepID=A0ABM7X8X1_9BACT|nr:molybdopterin converting factor subunit 1 [Anaeromyxobacter paludicola]BDG08302.1 molybdenum cofactor biosynthesis protein D/E [Anaeromyxobacter paludicola]
MNLTVLFFAAAREAAGLDRETIVLPEPADVAALRRALAERHPALARILPRCRMAAGEELVEEHHPLADGAEVAVIPPVSGGAPLFRVQDAPLSLAEVVAAVASPGRGAVVTFSGDVRSETRGRPVVRLEYEAYRSMAEKTLARIGAQLAEAHGAVLAIVHRVGVLQPGESAVVIAAAAPHRTPAFRACEEAIERLKRETPIWKREVFADGTEWVGLGP